MPGPRHSSRGYLVRPSSQAGKGFVFVKPKYDALFDAECSKSAYKKDKKKSKKDKCGKYYRKCHEHDSYYDDADPDEYCNFCTPLKRPVDHPFPKSHSYAHHPHPHECHHHPKSAEHYQVYVPGSYHKKVWHPCHVEYRSFDGSRNNKANPTWGKAGEQLLRKADPDYADGYSTLAERGASNPNPRTISNTVVKSNQKVKDPQGRSDITWIWGQFLDHEVDLTPEHHPEESANIQFPADPPCDPESGQIPFKRSIYDTATSVPGKPRQQINVISSYIDGSNVYGSDETRARALRLFDGTGRLKTQCGPDGPLPPYNDGNYDNAALPGQDASGMYLCGDVRSNENSALTSMHTLFIREHNRLAKELARQHPKWCGDDERLYQEARRIVIGLMQSITFNEFLPSLLGGKCSIPPYCGYDDRIDAGIFSEFSTALYRLGHSMVSETLRVENKCEDGGVSSVTLDEIFFNPEYVRENGIQALLLGASNQKQQNIDVHIVEALRTRLFGPPAGGMLLDLAALNIQRGRDHGIPGYNDVREAYGLLRKASIDDITSNALLRSNLKAAYGGDNPDIIDPWVGALAEDPVDSKTAVGELLKKGLLDQFLRLRDGDRFWFENDPTLPKWRKREICSTRLSDVIVRNTCLSRKHVREDVFHVHGYYDCSSSDDDDSDDSYCDHGCDHKKSKKSTKKKSKCRHYRRCRYH